MDEDPIPDRNKDTPVVNLDTSPELDMDDPDDPMGVDQAPFETEEDEHYFRTNTH